MDANSQNVTHENFDYSWFIRWMKALGHSQPEVLLPCLWVAKHGALSGSYYNETKTRGAAAGVIVSPTADADYPFYQLVVWLETHHIGQWELLTRQDKLIHPFYNGDDYGNDVNCFSDSIHPSTTTTESNNNKPHTDIPYMFASSTRFTEYLEAVKCPEHYYRNKTPIDPIQYSFDDLLKQQRKSSILFREGEIEQDSISSPDEYLLSDDKTSADRQNVTTCDVCDLCPHYDLAWYQDPVRRVRVIQWLCELAIHKNFFRKNRQEEYQPPLASRSTRFTVDEGTFPLGFSSNNYQVDQVASAMRIKCTYSLRQRQSEMNAVVRHLQNLYQLARIREQQNKKKKRRDAAAGEKEN